MEMLKPLLAAILDEASFDLEYKETGHSGGSRRPSVERISAAELRELATRQGQQVLDRSVRVRASDQAMSGLVDALRQVLGRFIDPESDRIGHAFPVGAANSYGCHSLRDNDLCDEEFTTPVRRIASALVQAGNQHTHIRVIHRRESCRPRPESNTLTQATSRNVTVA